MSFSQRSLPGQVVEVGEVALAVEVEVELGI
jgi:hypothetical protein